MRQQRRRAWIPQLGELTTHSRNSKLLNNPSRQGGGRTIWRTKDSSRRRWIREGRGIPTKGTGQEFRMDFKQPGQWEEGGDIHVNKPCGIFEPPVYINPEVYPNRNLLRFPQRAQIGKSVQWGEYKGKPLYLEKFIDPKVKEVDARDEFSTPRPPQYTVVAQKVAPHKPRPRYRWRLHRAVAAGDKKVSLKRIYRVALSAMLDRLRARVLK